MTPKIWAACQTPVGAVKADVPPADWPYAELDLQESIKELFWGPRSQLGADRRNLEAQAMPASLKAYYLCMIDTLIALDQGETPAGSARSGVAAAPVRPAAGPSGFAAPVSQAVPEDVADADAAAIALQRCVRPVVEGSSFGAFVNSCDVGVNVRWCAYGPKPDGWNAAFDCERTTGSMGGLTGMEARGRATAHVRNATIVWLVCAKPAYPTDVSFRTAPEPHLSGRCE